MMKKMKKTRQSLLLWLILDDSGRNKNKEKTMEADTSSRIPEFTLTIKKAYLIFLLREKQDTV